MKTLSTKKETIEAAENYCIENNILFSHIIFNLTKKGQVIEIEGTNEKFTYTDNQIYPSNMKSTIINN